MQLIFNKESAQALADKYTVLELETITKDGVTLDVFCVISAENINLGDLPQMEHHIKLHNHFVDALKTKDYKVCNDLYEHLVGKFNGELDSFYQEIIKRIHEEQNA